MQAPALPVVWPSVSLTPADTRPQSTGVSTTCHPVRKGKCPWERDNQSLPSLRVGALPTPTPQDAMHGTKLSSLSLVLWLCAGGGPLRTEEGWVCPPLPSLPQAFWVGDLCSEVALCILSLQDRHPGGRGWHCQGQRGCLNRASAGAFPGPPGQGRDPARCGHTLARPAAPSQSRRLICHQFS